MNGLALASLGRLNEARGTLSAAVERGADGFSFVLSVALGWLAAVERLRDDAVAADGYAERALAVAEHVGSPLLAALAKHELGRLAATRSEWSKAEPLLHESLTPTELEVARHAAAGRTNAQIGERMFISSATVKVHLSHIYTKLELSNRSQLAAEVTRRA